MGEYLQNQYLERDYAIELAKKHGLLESNKKLTWKELKEKAKEMGYKLGVYLNGKEYLVSTTETIITLSEIGTIEIKDGYENEVMFHNRTPDQMFAIMKALQ